MMANPKVFKAYDIRGVYARDFDENFAYQLGLCYARWLKQDGGLSEGAEITVGRDMRLSSPKLTDALVKGLIDEGVVVMDLGLVSTVTFYFAVAHYKTGGGIMVSCSHNPKEYNGFKIVRERAAPVSFLTGLEKIRELVAECHETLSDHETKVVNLGQVVHRNSALADQIKHDLSFVDATKIKPLKIVIDTANGMGALYFDELFKHLSCQIFKMNWPLDGTFPAHPADPFKPENVADLCARVKAEKADLGIATDGDADRIFFVDENGLAVEAGVARALLCKIFLADKPGSKICYDIRPGRITPETIIANGGTPIVTKVGHSLIKEKMIANNAYFAGESSGHFFLTLPSGAYEVPIICALKILLLLSESGQKLSEIIKPYQKYFSSGEINLTVDDVEKKLTAIKAKFSDGKIDELDGVSVEYPDYWFNVRGSNTEPVIRLNLEAISKEVMEKRRDEVLKVIGE